MTLPAGTIISWGGEDVTTVGENWLYCNGATMQTASYDALYKAIGNSFGGGTDTFNLPDLRGYFLRGVDDSSGHDPDAGSRRPLAENGNSGDRVGSFQADSFASHTHGVTSFGQDSFKSGGDYPASYTAGPAETEATGGTETRPTNVYCYFLIYTGHDS